MGKRLMPPSPENPKGYFEHLDIVAVHDLLLSALGRSWSDPRTLPLGWLDHPVARAMEAALGKWVDLEFPQDAVFAVKDPRISRFLPLWRRALITKGYDLRVLHVLRHPAEVAASLHARDGMHWNKGLLLWATYNMEIAACHATIPTFLLPYPDFMQGDFEWLDPNLRSMLGIDQERVAQAAEAFLAPDLRRQRVPSFDTDLLPGLERIVMHVHAALRGEVDTPEAVLSLWQQKIAPFLV